MGSFLTQTKSIYASGSIPPPMPLQPPSSSIRLTSLHSNTTLEKILALILSSLQSTRRRSFAGVQLPRKFAKNHWVQGSPKTDIKTKSEDIATLLKRSERPSSWAQRARVSLGRRSHPSPPLLSPYSLHSSGQSERRDKMSEESSARM